MWCGQKTKKKTRPPFLGPQKYGGVYPRGGIIPRGGVIPTPYISPGDQQKKIKALFFGSHT